MKAYEHSANKVEKPLFRLAHALFRSSNCCHTWQYWKKFHCARAAKERLLAIVNGKVLEGFCRQTRKAPLLRGVGWTLRSYPAEQSKPDAVSR